MKNNACRNDSLIAASYCDNFQRILHFINSRINNICDAENLAQDVWVRVLTCGRELTSETMVSFLFTIARNLVYDYIRRSCVISENNEEISVELASRSVLSPESEVSAADIAYHEQKRIECLPAQRRIIYIMSRFEDKNVDDIATELSLSSRTVENHLRLGRRDIRTYISAIA